jgi:hypothetical protein
MWFMLIDCSAYTVGIYSPGKAFVVYEMSRQVLPTALDEMMVHRGMGYQRLENIKASDEK